MYFDEGRDKVRRESMNQEEENNEEVKKGWTEQSQRKRVSTCLEWNNLLSERCQQLNGCHFSIWDFLFLQTH